jgi:hypothetical protein
MPAKKYIVSLTKNERQILQELTQKGKAAARKINHARIDEKQTRIKIVGDGTIVRLFKH